jgi:hypothetical protein
MSQTETIYPLIRMRSIGNSINLAVYLYRYHLKQYFKLSLRAHLWLLVPIYGWAKFYAISALLSRLAFSEIIGQKETQKEAQSKIYPRMWNFLIAGILVFIIPLIWMFFYLIVVSLIWGILYALLMPVFGLPKISNPANPFDGLLYTMIFIPIAISVYLSPLWFYSRLFIAELPLAIENKSNAFKTIQKNWKLTKGFRFNLLKIISLAYSITLPIQVLVGQSVGRILGLIIRRVPVLSSLSSSSSVLLSFGILIILGVVSGIITLPFWQALKATVYYDLRCRKEGFDLHLHNLNTDIDQFN